MSFPRRSALVPASGSAHAPNRMRPAACDPGWLRRDGGPSGEERRARVVQSIPRGPSRCPLDLAAAVCLCLLVAVSSTAALVRFSAPPFDDGAFALGVSTTDVPGQPAALNAWVARVGGAPSVVMWFQTWAEPLFYPGTLEEVDAHGATPMITWEPLDASASRDQPDPTLHAIADGRHDAYLRDSARAAAAWEKPLYVRFAPEMNGDWFPWGIGVNGNTAADYVGAWRHIVTMFREEGATNVRWVWSPNVEENGRYPFASLYPGDAWVDWVALDGYNWGALDPGTGWRSLGELFGPSHDALSAMTDKPIMIAETASTELGGDKAAWIRSGFLSDIPTQLPDVRIVIWFDRNKETDWRINSSEASLAAYRDVVASPLYKRT